MIAVARASRPAHVIVTRTGSQVQSWVGALNAQAVANPTKSDGRSGGRFGRLREDLSLPQGFGAAAAAAISYV